MNYKAFLFDFDGLVVDTEYLHREAVRLTATQLGACVARGELQAMAGESSITVAAQVIARYQLHCHSTEFIERKSQVLQTLLNKRGCSLMPGVEELFKYCDRMDLRRALVTNANRFRELQPILDTLSPRAQLLLCFDSIVTGDMVARRKPHPDTYLYAMQLLGVAACNCVAFEDSASGLRAAHDAGCYVVGVNCPDRRTGYADAWVETLKEALATKPWEGS